MITSESPQDILAVQSANSNKSELSKLGIKDLFFKYIRFLPFFILSAAIALLIAFAYLRYATRIYSAAGSLQISGASSSGNSDRVEDILMGGNRSQSIQSEIEVLRSRPLMARVVNRLNLQFSYTAIGRVKDENVYKRASFLMRAFEIADSSRPFSMDIKFVNENKFRVNNESTTFNFNEVFRNKHGVFSLEKKANPAEGSDYKVEWLPTGSVARSFAGMVSVSPKPSGTGLIISMEATNPQLAADIVNSLMVQYDSLTIEQKNFSTEQMLGFIDIRLDKLKNELDSIQGIALAYRQKMNLIDVGAQSGNYFENITTADRNINAQQLQITVADMINDYLRDEKNQFSKVIVPSSLGLGDNTLNDLVNGYNKAQLTRQSLLESNIPPANPLVKEAEALIEQQRQMVLENLANIKSSFNNAISQLRKRSSSEQTEWEAMPYKTKELIELERQISTKLALYSLLESKREEAAISKASTISNSKIIDMASASSVPIKPNDTTIKLVALLIGLAIPAFVIFISEMLNDKVSNRYDVEKVTPVPILGEVGHSSSGKALVINKVSRSMVAEQFRIIRSNLQYVISRSEKPVILVTSSFSGEGKSFISINMGAVIALTGKKTVILEFDIRKPKILSGLEMAKRPGITNYLVGKAELKDLIVPVPGQENLFVLPCGPVPPNPSELLLDTKVSEMFHWLRQNFDSVIIDTAPIGMVSDAMTLGKFADTTLYLVRQGYTFKKQVILIDDLYREQKLPSISIIMNDIQSKGGYGYYGGRYGYGYGYGNNGYYEDEVGDKKDGTMGSLLSRVAIGKRFRKKR